MENQIKVSKHDNIDPDKKKLDVFLIFYFF